MNSYYLTMFICWAVVVDGVVFASVTALVS
jgi:hypothetical protein